MTPLLPGSKSDQQFYDSSLTHKGAWGKSERLPRLPGYGFLLPPSTFKNSESSSEGQRSKTPKICDFMTLWRVQGVILSVFRLFAYDFLLPPNTF